MHLMMSWKLGERPHLDSLPMDNPIALLKVIFAAAKGGRDAEVYLADGAELKQEYPEPVPEKPEPAGQPEMTEL